MDRLEEIRQKLLAGQEAKELVKAGYARTSVYAEAKKLRSRVPASVPDDELADLRKRKDILKLGKGIVDIEASKEKLPARVEALEKLPDRVAALEREVVALRKLIRRAVNAALAASFLYTAAQCAGSADEELTPGEKAYCAGWVERNIERL